jgi:serine/threonine-protein kinase RsbW
VSVERTRAHTTIELDMPASPELMTVVRFTAATLASLSSFSIEEIDDIRLAVEELCLSLTGGRAGVPMHLVFVRDEDLLEVSCIVALASTWRAPEGDPQEEWSRRILEALVDEHGQEVVDDGCRAWIRKRRSRSSL